MMVKIRIKTRNNSDARALRFLVSRVHGVTLRHNGGEILIATMPEESLGAAREALEEDNSVLEFEVE